MKNKRANRTKTTQMVAKESAGGAQSAPTNLGPILRAPTDEDPIVTEDSFGRQVVLPSPSALLGEAEQEPDQTDLEEYTDVMVTLREKGFSYREIAAWLVKRGVPIDHNTVYRLYTKTLSHEEAAHEAMEAEQEAIEEGLRNR